MSDHLELRLEEHRTELCRLLGWTDEMWDLRRPCVYWPALEYAGLVSDLDGHATRPCRPTYGDAVNWLSGLEQRLNSLMQHLSGAHISMFASFTLDGMPISVARKLRTVCQDPRIGPPIQGVVNEESGQLIRRLGALRDLASQTRESIENSGFDTRRPLAISSPARWLAAKCISIWLNYRTGESGRPSDKPHHNNQAFIYFVELMHTLSIGDVETNVATTQPNFEHAVRVEWALYQKIKAAGPPEEGWAFWMFDPFYESVMRLRMNG